MLQFLLLKKNALHLLISGCILSFPIVFLTVRHGVHVPLFVLLILALIYFTQKYKEVKVSLEYWSVRAILIACTGLLVATFISQLFRLNFHFSAYDGPSRLLIAGIVFLYLRNTQVPFMKLLEIAIPIGLLATLATLLLNPETYWYGRFATYFVDPNSLGSQTLILTAVVLLSMRFSGNNWQLLTALKIVGGIAGIYITVHAGSRGGWVAVPFILMIVLYIQLSNAMSLSGKERSKKLIQIFSVLLVFIAILLSLFASSDSLVARITSGYNEIRNWLTGEDLNGSAGIRLSMWKISLQLSQQSILFGYGFSDKDIAFIIKGSVVDIPANSTAIHDLIVAGPHSDILSKLLSLGLVGLIAYLCLLAIPFFIFLLNKSSSNVDIRRASHIGMYYIAGVFICGLSNEQMSLKYLCSFYGLMIAALAAEVLRKKVFTSSPLSS